MAAAIRTTTTMILRDFFRPFALPIFRSILPIHRLQSRAMPITYTPTFRWSAAGEGSRKKRRRCCLRFSRYCMKHKRELYKLEMILFPKSLSENIRINKDGEIVISSTKTRKQKGNIEFALGKLQAIIDAASKVPPLASEEQVKKIAKIAAIGEQKRLQGKKVLSQKKAFRRSQDSYY